MAALKEQLAEAANARDSDRNLRKRCVCPVRVSHPTARYLMATCSPRTWQGAVPRVLTTAWHSLHTVAMPVRTPVMCWLQEPGDAGQDGGFAAHCAAGSCGVDCSAGW